MIILLFVLFTLGFEESLRFTFLPIFQVLSDSAEVIFWPKTHSHLSPVHGGTKDSKTIRLRTKKIASSAAGKGAEMKPKL